LRIVTTVVFSAVHGFKLTSRPIIADHTPNQQSSVLYGYRGSVLRLVQAAGI